MDSESKSQVSSDILLWTQRCAAHPAHRLSLVGNLCMDGQKNRRRTDIELAIIHRVCSPPIVSICMDGTY
jgi:hypothetical protein